MIKKLIKLLTVMLIITVTGAIFIELSSQNEDTEVIRINDKLNIVTTIYPVYLIGLNLTDQVDSIEVHSLIDRNVGCLHDYQLTTDDMKAIAEADILIINGGGMEGFLEDVIANDPNLTIIDASKGISMLCDGEEASEENRKGEDHGEYNSHVWLNPQLYIKQIENVKDELNSYINSSKYVINSNSEEITQTIEKNALTYIEDVQELDNEFEEFINSTEQSSDQKLTNMQAVIFHESFAYLAKRIGMKVAFTVEIESDTSLSAGNIAKIIDEIRKEDIKYLFTESQYSDSIAMQMEEETAAKVYIIDSVVTGDGTKNSYLKAMQNNLEVLKAAIQ